MTNYVFDTYKNSVMPHGKHMLKTAYGMDVATMCAYKSSKYALPHWRCVLRCCAKFQIIDLPSPESDQKNSNASTKICLIVHYTMHGGHPFNERKQCQLYEDYSD